jgi:hypothetical protein
MSLLKSKILKRGLTLRNSAVLYKLNFLDNRLTDTGEVLTLTRRPPFTPGKIPGTHFC